MSLKYKVGDSFLLRMTIDSVDDSGSSLPYCMGEEADGMWLSEKAIDKLSAKAAVYAAKAAPAPTAWEPKPGERILMEVTYIERDTETGDAVIEFDYTKPMFFPRAIMPRAAIVGPAPVRARFAVGDEAFSMSLLRPVKLRRYDHSDNTWQVIDGDVTTWACDDELIALDEARERLGKK
jgi:hypothetical protein